MKFLRDILRKIEAFLDRRYCPQCGARKIRTLNGKRICPVLWHEVVLKN
jgi:uncharacterized Zn finger protein (UPF0148 family)